MPDIAQAGSSDEVLNSRGSGNALYARLNVAHLVKLDLYNSKANPTILLLVAFSAQLW